MYLVKTPLLIQRLFKGLTWRIQNSNKIYLTFDDGPVPEATPWVLDTLNSFDVKATFFCVGSNVEKYPEIYDRIINEGHSVGNHTYNHLNSWKTSNEEYLQNIKKANTLIDSSLFRPPFGKFSLDIIKQLSPDYDVIMWDVLSGDFDVNISSKECYDNVVKNTKKGSIIVFHDSKKAIKTLKNVLPKLIEHFQLTGLEFGIIE